MAPSSQFGHVQYFYFTFRVMMRMPSSGSPTASEEEARHQHPFRQTRIFWASRRGSKATLRHACVCRHARARRNCAWACQEDAHRKSLCASGASEELGGASLSRRGRSEPELGEKAEVAQVGVAGLEISRSTPPFDTNWVDRAKASGVDPRGGWVRQQQQRHRDQGGWSPPQTKR